MAMQMNGLAAIPLAAGVPGPDPAVMQANQANGLRLMQMHRAQQAQNALRQMAGQPGAMDANGMPTANTLSRIMQIDPATGMAMQDDLLKMQQTRAGTANIASEMAMRKMGSALQMVGEPAKLLYDQQIAAGIPPAQARLNAQARYTEGMRDLTASGMFSPDEVARMHTTFDPQRIGSNMQWLQHQEAMRRDKVEEAQAGQRLGIEGDNLALNRERTAAEIEKLRHDAENAKYSWQPGVGLDDAGKQVPGTWRLSGNGQGEPKFYPGVVETPKGQTLTPEDKQHGDEMAAMIAEYRAPPLAGYAIRSPYGQYVMGKVAALNPDYQAPQYNSRNKAVSAFGAGPQGNQVRFLNTSISHLDTLQQAAEALATGNVRAVNSLTNAFQREFGVAAPTNFEAAKNIVGQEVVKAITGSSAAESDRQAAQNAFDKANSPEALVGAISTVKALLGGQMRSLRKQYEDTTGLKNFDTRLTPEAKAALEGSAVAPGDKPAATSGGPAPQPLPMVMQDGRQVPDASKLKDGDTYTLPDGRRAKFDEKRMGFSVVQN